MAATTTKEESPKQKSLKMCIEVMSDAIEELQLLENMFNLPKLEEDWKYQSLEEKYGDETSKELIINTESDEEVVYKRQVNKFQRDRNFCEHVLEQMKNEILETERLNKTIDFLDLYEKEVQEEHDLIKHSHRLTGDIEKLQARMEKNRLEGVKVIREHNEAIGKYKDEYENLLQQNNIKRTYISKWETSKLEQVQNKSNQGEALEQNRIQDFRNKFEHEKRIHNEIVNYINLIIKDHETNMVYWENKYIEDLKQKESNIAEIKNTKIGLKLKITAMAALFKERAEEMRAYKQLKEEQRLKAEAEAHLHAQATKIEAWWRGVMVRRQLGPYKVKKPKSKPTKGKSAIKT